MKIQLHCKLIILTCLICAPISLLAQSQIGFDIDGEAAGDNSGFSVSLAMDGNRLAIGAPQNDGNGEGSGHVRVYQWSGSTWEQLGADIDGEVEGDKFGASVSLSSDGSRLAVGSYYNDGNGTNSGHVRVFQWSDSAWIQLGDDIDGEAENDAFGGYVSLNSDGSRLAAGAVLNDDNGVDSGNVRVFQWSGSAWEQLGADIEGEAAGDRFGRLSLSSDGSRLAIGGRFNDGNGEDAGHARVYQWTGLAWVQLGTDIDGEAAGDIFGASVSLSSDGDRLAVGAYGNDNNGTDSGHVRVFQWSDSAWIQLGADIDGEFAGDNSGHAVSLSSSGSRVAIGAPNNGNGAGQVRIYQWSGSAWEQLGADINGEAAADAFGTSVSMSSDGSRVAIGAQTSSVNGEGSGQVRVYDLSMFNELKINPGLNDAWYNPVTDGQGFFITVFPDLGAVSMAWFTYDTELPPEDAQANLGDAGHRWMTAIGPISGNQATLNIQLTSGGLFDTSTEIDRTDPEGSDGTIILTFDSCNSGTAEYDIPSINRQGIVPIQRIANDNIWLCEAFNSN